MRKKSKFWLMIQGYGSAPRVRSNPKVPGDVDVLLAWLEINLQVVPDVV
jgi:hypothetical protein